MFVHNENDEPSGHDRTRVDSVESHRRRAHCTRTDLLRVGDPLTEAVSGHGRLGLGRRKRALAVDVDEDGADDDAVEHLGTLSCEKKGKAERKRISSAHDATATQQQAPSAWKQRKERDDTHAELGELEPEDEEALEGKVPGEVVEDDAAGEALDKGEEAKDDPVRQPLDVVLVAGALERLDGEVGGQGPADEIRDGGRERVDRVEEDEEDGDAEEGVALGHLRALLERVEERVLGELAGAGA